MRRFLAVFLLLGCGVVARADSLQVFNFNATLEAPGFATGTLTLDTTTGLFTSENILVVLSSPRPSYPASYLFSSIYEQGEVSYPTGLFPNYTLNFVVESEFSTTAYLRIELPSASLIGYTGSVICAGNYSCSRFSEQSTFIYDNGSPYGAIVGFSSGTLTPVAAVPSAVTPEPSSLWLLGTGLCGLVVVVRGRLRVA